MSRGFVKEDDQEEVPMVPQRAFLPAGVPNFVTPAGMNQLLEERKALLNERDSIDIHNENERRLAVNNVNARLQLLNNRIAEAKVVSPEEQSSGEVRFGATVTLKVLQTGKMQTLQIVGVDEAAISKGKISFISPLARALINKKKGEKAVLKREREEILYEIAGITYA